MVCTYVCMQVCLMYGIHNKGNYITDRECWVANYVAEMMWSLIPIDSL